MSTPGDASSPSRRLAARCSRERAEFRQGQSFVVTVMVYYAAVAADGEGIGVCRPD